MSKIKKVIAVLSAAVISLTFAACGKDKSWSGKSGDTTLTPGTYIYGCIQGFSDATNALTDKDKDKDIFDYDIDGISTKQYIRNYAVEFMKKGIATEQKFDELGLMMTEDDEKGIQSNVDTTMSAYGATYKKLGIGESTLTYIQTLNMKNKMIIDKLYSDGEIKFTDEEIDSYYTENYALVRYLPIPVSDTEDTSAKVEAYKERLENGEDFMTIYDEYFKETKGDDYTVSEDDLADEGRGLMLISHDFYYLSSEVIDKMISMEVGNIEVYNTDTICYLIQKYDILADEEMKESNEETVLGKMKSEVFNDLIKEWAEKVQITLNDDFCDDYDLKKIKEVLNY